MNNLNSQPLFFLGANSPYGFVSKFGDSFSAAEGWHTYIIKGGPGTGKSTLMKRVADYFITRGLRCHLCPCSSDTGSLDAVIFPDIKVVLLDGTAPHVVEPKFPGACEEIINLGECWDIQKLKDVHDDIIKYTTLNKECHCRASAYLSAAGAVLEDSAAAARSLLNEKKAREFGKKLAKKHIPKTGAVGKEWVRYLSAVTPKGHIFYKNTLTKLCSSQIVICDEYGAASAVILKVVRDYAMFCGHEIITCYCPMSPEYKIEHIIIPALSLCFVTSNRYHKLESDERAIHARRFMDVKELHKIKHRFSYNKKAAAELLSMATEALSEAKALHDRLEECYINAMDFDGLDAYAKITVRNILELMP